MSSQVSGLMAWLIQRASALYLAPVAVWLVLKFALDPPHEHAELIAWLDQPSVLLALMLAVPAILAHAWIGVRDVLIDYVRPLGLRLGLMLILGLVLLGSGLWTLKALFAIGLGD